jgi:hypothetical protein
MFFIELVMYFLNSVILLLNLVQILTINKTNRVLKEDSDAQNGETYLPQQIMSQF